MTTAFLGDPVLDGGMNYLNSKGSALFICSQLPANYTGASSTYALGTKATPTLSAAQDGVTTGRRVVVSAITGGSVTGSGTATHYAIVDTTGTALLAAGPLSSSQAVTSGNTFTLTAFSVTLPDAA